MEESETGIPPPVPRTITESELLIKEQWFETAFVWDAAGNLVLRKDGEAAKITFEDDELPLIRDSLFLHNHPGGQTLSRQDVVFIGAFNPSEFRVITPTHRYKLKRLGAAWPETLTSIYDKNFRVVYGRRLPDLRRGKITQAEFSRRVYADAIRKTARDLALGYSEEEL